MSGDPFSGLIPENDIMANSNSLSIAGNCKCFIIWDISPYKKSMIIIYLLCNSAAEMYVRPYTVFAMAT